MNESGVVANLTDRALEKTSNATNGAAVLRSNRPNAQRRKEPTVEYRPSGHMIAMSAKQKKHAGTLREIHRASTEPFLDPIAARISTR